MRVAVSDRQGAAAREAIALLSNQAAGLAATGSKKTVQEINRALEALGKVAAAAPGPADLTPEEKVRVQRAAFLLEGTRAGLDGADFPERARAVQRTIDDLAEVVGKFNAAGAESIQG